MVVKTRKKEKVKTFKTKKLSGLNRNTIDKFYTKSNIAEKCVKEFNNLVKLNKNDLIIEPSAGNGSFIEPIKNLGTKYLFYDIKPENKEVQKKDFLKVLIPKVNGKIHTIGNPPFGRQSNLARKFILKASEYSETISFILPKSFKKPSMKKIFPINYHLIYQMDLPKN